MFTDPFFRVLGKMLQLNYCATLYIEVGVITARSFMFIITSI